jgi:FtsZ-binding cell division protein ZapB
MSDISDWDSCTKHETAFLRHGYCKDCRIEELKEANDALGGLIVDKTERIAELEALLRRAHHELNTWQDPMIGPFERLLNDIEAMLGDEK